MPGFIIIEIKTSNTFTAAAAGKFVLPPVITNYRDCRDLLYIEIKTSNTLTAAAAGKFVLPPVITNYRGRRDLLHIEIKTSTYIQTYILLLFINIINLFKTYLENKHLQ